MEKSRNIEPDPEYDAHIELIKKAFLEQARRLGIDSESIPEAANDPLVAMLYDNTIAALEAVGIKADSLDMTAAWMELLDDEDEPDSGQGGLGVREPRRPFPGLGSAIVELGLPTEDTDETVNPVI